MSAVSASSRILALPAGLALRRECHLNGAFQKCCCRGRSSKIHSRATLDPQSGHPVSPRSVRSNAFPRQRHQCKICHTRTLPGVGGTSPPRNGSNWFGGWGGGGAFGASRALSAVASSAPQLGSEEVILLDVSGVAHYLFYEGLVCI